MERIEVLDMMGQLKLYGMKAAYDETLAVANTIAQLSAPAAMMAKEAVNRAYESPLSEGMLFERRLFHSLFATEDQKEGMAAFLEKRPARFQGR